MDQFRGFVIERKKSESRRHGRPFSRRRSTWGRSQTTISENWRFASPGMGCVFAEFGLGSHGSMVRGVGLSVEDFVWEVLSQYAEGALAYQADRGELFSLLARALRNDIIDALRKAAHFREEPRSPVPQEDHPGIELPALSELPDSGSTIDSILVEQDYRARLLDAMAQEPNWLRMSAWYSISISQTRGRLPRR